MNKKIKNRIRAKGCDGKIVYKYLTSAEYALDNNDDKTMEIYKCDFCKNYHLGHSNKLKKKKKKNGK